MGSKGPYLMSRVLILASRFVYEAVNSRDMYTAPLIAVIIIKNAF